MIDQTAIAAAIAFLESHREGYGMARAMAKENGAMQGTITQVEDMIANIETSIAALRECAERRDGCEVCNTPIVNPCTTCDRHSHRGKVCGSYMNCGSYYVYSKAVEFLKRNFCPMCGRKLERGDT